MKQILKQTQHSQSRRCINCGKHGHIYKSCPHPLISYGIILFRVLPCKSVEYLMICRRHTFGYVEFVRCTFNIFDKDYIEQLISEMTVAERVSIQTEPYIKLWNSLWLIQKDTEYRYQKDYARAHSQFNELCNFSFVKSILLTYEHYAKWECPEWGFPKGKRNKHETGLVCAKREMTEETNIREQSYRVLRDFNMVSECFKGSDNLIYQHNYYIAQTFDTNLSGWIDDKNIMQLREVSNLKWLTFEDCMHNIRPYNLAKKELLTKINNSINVYINKQYTLQQKFGTTNSTRKFFSNFAIHINTSNHPHIKIIDFLQTQKEIAIRKAYQAAKHAALDAQTYINEIEGLLPKSDDDKNSVRSDSIS